MRRTSMAILAAGLCAGVVASCSPAQLTANGRKAVDVVARTKTARLTYAIYSWNLIAPPDAPPGAAPRGDWSAEFNSGPRHRVEVSTDRAVADCDAMTGAALHLETGAVTSGAQVAHTACGIDDNATFESQEWLGLVDTPFGKADRVRLTDAHLVRLYDIDPRGVILREVLTRRDAHQTRAVLTVAVAYEPVLPPGLSFDEASLHTSFTPDRYKQPPPKGVALN